MAAAYSCVYPFTPADTVTEQRLVIEGDIIVGGTTEVKLSYLSPFDVSGYTSPSAKVSVESSSGEEYVGRWSKEDIISDKDPEIRTITVDLTSATPTDKYRLRVYNNDNGHEYLSDWLDVRVAPVIDSIGYVLDEEAEQMVLHLTAHSDSGEKYFRWTYDEDWEYHSYHNARVYYVPPAAGGIIGPRMGDYGSIEFFEWGENIYNCWDKAQSTEIMLATTEELSENKLTNHIFRRIDRHDMRIQTIYRVNLKMEAISKAAYDYWNNLDNISSYGGSLFSPNPSEVRGNIRCVSDTTELVLGYINASTQSSMMKYVHNSETLFYRSNMKYELDEEVPEDEWYLNYSLHNKIPVNPVYDMMGNITGYTWCVKRCVDCRYYGGTKNKPEGWPSTTL